MELFLIRHGQSANNANPGGVRHHDPELTDVGLQQAVKLGEWAAALNLTRLIASPFLRALQTAEEIRARTGVRAHVWVDIHEQGGCCTGPDPMLDLEVTEYQGHPGLTDAEIRDAYPHFDVPPDIDHRGWWRSRPAESMDQARIRAAGVISAARENYGHTDERIGLVFHGMLKLMVLDAMFGGYTHEDWAMIEVPYNTSVSHITITPERTDLQFFNGVEHLPAELLTI